MTLANDNRFIQRLKEINLINGLSYVNGYISTAGTISAPDAFMREITYEMVDRPLDSNESYLILQRYQAPKPTQTGWIAVGLWDADGNWIRRNTGGISREFETNEYWYTVYTPLRPESNAAKIRISTRTFSYTEIYFVAITDLMNLLLSENITTVAEIT